ncbi:MAG TPA: hypothetical protein PKY12_06560 [Catalimonadaceae bacterium]|nr:hypothetical protein [Catalimonadaceae bacterium]
MSLSYYQKAVNIETWWENHKKDWLTTLKQSPLYEELKAKFDPQTLDKNLEHLATRRSHTYRYGPAKLLDQQRQRYKYLPYAFELIEQVQAKKLFNFGMLWRGEKIKVPGLWHTFQLYKIEGNTWSTRFITLFSDEDLKFLKHLLQDDVFINTRQKWKFNLTIKSSEVVEDDGEPIDKETLDHIYPLLYERYDEWFGTAHLMHLPDIRSKKLEELHDALVRSQGKEPVNDAEIPPSTEKSFWEQSIELTDGYFRKEEPAELNRLLDAHDLFFPDGNCTDELEYQTAFDELVKTEDPGYPDGSVNWLDASVYLGRRILFSKIHDVLDDAFAEYRYNMAHNIPMNRRTEIEDPLHLPPDWIKGFEAARTYLGLSTNPEDL